jgi:hypothetical protein
MTRSSPGFETSASTTKFTVTKHRSDSGLFATSPPHPPSSEAEGGGDKTTERGCGRRLYEGFPLPVPWIAPHGHGPSSQEMADDRIGYESLRAVEVERDSHSVFRPN